MKQRAFNAIIRTITVGKRKKVIDRDLASRLPDDVRDGMVRYIVRCRAPVLKELLSPSLDRRWLTSCGYMYPFTNAAGYSFIGTCADVA